MPGRRPAAGDGLYRRDLGGESGEGHISACPGRRRHDGRGVALRYRMRTLALPAAQQKDYLAQLVESVGANVRSADLLIDLEFLDPDVEVHAEDLGPAIAGALTVGDWRSVVVLGTAMPSMLSCIPEGTVGALARKEWQVWTSLAQAGLKRLPTYGDYAVQHSRPPQDAGGPSMRANIRYTVETVTLVARGRGSVLQAGKDQYVSLCQELLARDEFSGRDYSWGDGVIEDCAKGRTEPGAQNVWRGAGTSHHLRFVTDQLRRRATTV